MDTNIAFGLFGILGGAISMIPIYFIGWNDGRSSERRDSLISLPERSIHSIIIEAVNEAEKELK
ncbi:MAG: hypothetical protein JKY50_22690 [Oleispira sp.]|nr:hypothetical protein [Oleispira sp.]